MAAVGALFILLFTSACTTTSPAEQKSTAVVHPEWSKNAVIYEVNIRQYTPEGTLKAFEAHLPRLQKMGVDILWLMPIQPIGALNRKGSLGSYYSIKDYLAINPEFGTMDDFKSVVDHAHELGMKVILDWVGNHTSWDNELIKTHPEWYKKDSTGKIIPPVADWTDVAALDYSQPGLNEYMQNALAFYLEKVGIDGYRCDVAGMIPFTFWNSVVPQLKKIKPIFMLAEDEGVAMHDSAFDMTYSWEMFHLMNDIYKGTKSANYFDTLFAKEAATFPPDAYRMRFTSNHDENSWNGTEFERLGEAAPTFAALTFLIPGMPLIYSGQEAAWNKRLKFFDKDTIGWSGYIYEPFYTKLIQLKKSNPALWNGLEGGKIEKIRIGDPQSIFAFIRKKDSNQLFMIFNLSKQKQSVKFEESNLMGMYVNQQTGLAEKFPNKNLIVLQPWEYRIYKME